MSAAPISPPRVGDGAPIASGPQLSSEPLIRFLHRRLPETLVAAYLLFVAYLSFVPFDFVALSQPGPGLRGVFGLRLSPFHLADILANIGVYVPLGLGLYAVLRRAGLPSVASAGFTTVAGLGLSVGVEYGQRFFASRVASWEDVVANTLGAILGLALAWSGEACVRRLVEAARDQARENWWLAASKVAVVLVLLIQLRPYDVVPDPVRALRHTILQRDPAELLAWNRLEPQWKQDVLAGRRSQGDLARMKYEYALDRVTDVLHYAGVAAICLLGICATGASTLWACGAAGLVVLVLSSLVAIIRSVLVSHGFDAAQLLCGAMAWPIGCGLGIAAEPSRRSFATEPGGAGDSTRSRWPAGILLLVVALVFAYEWCPFDMRQPADAFARAWNHACLVPFLWHFRSRPNDALYDISGDFLRYAALGTCLALALRQGSARAWRTQAVLAVGAVAAAALLFQITHLFIVSRAFDVTSVLLGACGGFAGCVSVRWYFDYRRFVNIRVVEDMLTSQLVDGASYGKNRPSTPRGSRRSGASPTAPVESHPPS